MGFVSNFMYLYYLLDLVSVHSIYLYFLPPFVTFLTFYTRHLQIYQSLSTEICRKFVKILLEENKKPQMF